MLIIIETGQLITEGQFREMHPNTSFPKVITKEMYAEKGAAVVFPTPQPTFDPITQTTRDTQTARLTELGTYEQVWEVMDLDEETITANQAKAKVDSNTDIIAQILILQNKCLRCLVEDAPDTTWLDKYKEQITELRSQLQ